MQNKKMKLFVLTAITLFNVNVIAKTAPHTWNVVTSNDGVWEAKLQMLNENGYFVSRDGKDMSHFIVNTNQKQEFGFGFNSDADFDIAYTLTLLQKSTTASPQFSSKACVYVITASGPAKPDVRIMNYNGASCEWQVVAGVGESYTVS